MSESAFSIAEEPMKACSPWAPVTADGMWMARRSHGVSVADVWCENGTWFWNTKQHPTPMSAENMEAAHTAADAVLEAEWWTLFSDFRLWVTR